MTLTGHIVGTKGNTGRGIASIVENADYTITINLTDGSSFTTAPIAGFTAVEFDENYDLVVTKTDGTTEIVETDIEDFRTLLVGYKNETYSYMQGAINSASSASSSATSASGSATDAATSAGQAYNHATSAQTAKTAAETAQGKAEDAQNAAETAQGKAEDAQDAAETAQTAAETAQTAAETAQASAQSSATSASSSATSASTSASTATTKASEASASATAAAGSASAAAASAEEAAESAASLTVDDELDGSSTNPVQNKVIKDELDSKANVDGYYESLGSGTADQLASNIYEEDNTPYNFRTSGGSIDIGDRETDMLVGGSVAWNQMVSNARYNTTTINGVTYTKNDDGSVSVSGTASAFTSIDFVPNEIRTIFPNHVYYMHQPAGASQATYFVRTGGSHLFWNYKTISKIDVQNAVGGLRFAVQNGITVNVTFYPQLFDLTQMFGSTIADYIYNLEQATAGAGVAWFKKLFPKPYYAYNAGELMSVQAVSHNTVGFNAWDEEWELGYYNVTTGEPVTSSSNLRSKNFIPVVPNTFYYAKIPTGYIAICEYDADKNFIKCTQGITNSGITTTADTHFIRFHCTSAYGTTYNNDICINISWDSERDGEYEAYVKHSYALDNSLTLRGIPKLDNGNLYYDGDTYESDGTVTRKYGIVDLGTVTWHYADAQDCFYTYGFREYTKQAPNVICSKYPYVGIYADLVDKSCGYIYGNAICVMDESFNADTAAFKTAMSGVYLIYELATPTTETADPYTNPQFVNDFGTEEYVDYPYSQGTRDVAIPVGHQTQYMANLKAKLEMSPSSPEGAGDYIVRQTNGENEYVTLASNATIQDIIARLEALEGGE